MVNPSLTIDIDAQTSKFQKGMDDISAQADKAMSDIESQFASFDPKLNIEAFTQSIAGMASIFGVVGGAVGGVIALVVSLNHSLAEMADTSDRVGLSFEKFQELKFGANSLGISDNSFTSSLDALATKLQEAKFQENELTRLFKSQPGELGKTNVKVQDMADLLTKVVDIIKRAPSLQDALQIGAMAGIAKDFSQQIFETGDNFDKLSSQAKDAGAVLNDETVQKARDFDREWTKATASWSTGMRSALNGILPLMKDLLDGITLVTELTAGLYQIAVKLGSIGNLALPQLLDPHSFAGQGDDLLNVFGQIIAKAKEAQEAKEKVGGVSDAVGGDVPTHITINKGPHSVNPGPKSTGNGGSAFDSASNSIARHTATINADTAAVFENKAVQAQLRAEFQLLDAIRKDDGEVTQEQLDKYEKLRATMSAQEALTASGITLTDKHAESFTKLSENVGTATGRLGAAHDALLKINSASQQFGSALSSAFSESSVQGDKLNVVLSNLLKTLANSAINSAFGSIFNAPTTGGLSPFASLFKSIIPAFAAGTDFAPGGMSLVGENGPELVNLPRGAQVVPNDVVSRMGGGGVYNDNRTLVVGPGASQETVAQLKATFEADRRDRYSQFLQMSKDARSRGFVS